MRFSLATQPCLLTLRLRSFPGKRELGNLVPAQLHRPIGRQEGKVLLPLAWSAALDTWAVGSAKAWVGGWPRCSGAAFWPTARSGAGPMPAPCCAAADAASPRVI